MLHRVRRKFILSKAEIPKFCTLSASPEVRGGEVTVKEQERCQSDGEVLLNRSVYLKCGKCASEQSVILVLCC